MNSTWMWPVVKWGVLLPTAVVGLLFGARWTMASKDVQTKPPQAQAQQVAVSDQAKREYVLEVIGLGVTLDKYRQGKLWEALQAGSPQATIREQDKQKYEWSADDKGGGSAVGAAATPWRTAPNILPCITGFRSSMPKGQS